MLPLFKLMQTEEFDTSKIFAAFFFISSGPNTFKMQNFILLHLPLLYFLFWFGCFPEFFFISIVTMSKQNWQGRLSNSLRTADESNGLLKDFIYIIEHRENRGSETDMLTY